MTPLLYEERIPDLEVNDRAIDAWFDRITDGLSEAQKADLKRKYARKGEVYSADDRIRLIASSEGWTPTVNNSCYCVIGTRRSELVTG